eukprot:GEMP01064411.1.p1 GENE.GEMP01064411.1~~GEMP01064411.1.p1  ORF type:complete len:108 (+),score=18.81 GEMP01064411.1:54-377(+)
MSQLATRFQGAARQQTAKLRTVMIDLPNERVPLPRVIRSAAKNDFVYIALFKLQDFVKNFGSNVKLASEVFPVDQMPQIPEVKMPKMPEVKIPEMPDIKMPKLPGKK